MAEFNYGVVKRLKELICLYVIRARRVPHGSKRITKSLEKPMANAVLLSASRSLTAVLDCQ